MSDDHSFSADWLRLREPFDHAARSEELVVALASHLPDAPEVLELACGLGSGLRFVAPRLKSRAHWTLLDHNPLLLDAAEVHLRDWSVHHPEAAPRSLHLLPHDLRDGLPDTRPHAVVTQALLDLVSEPWLVVLANWLAERRCPFLGALTVDGRVHWQAEAPLDAEVQAAFRAHQRLDRGFGASPGPEATRVLVSLLEDRGFTVRVVQADWQVPAEATEMLRFMVDGTAEAARVTHPEPERVDAWQRQRLSDLRHGTLSLTVGHLDLLALP